MLSRTIMAAVLALVPATVAQAAPAAITGRWITADGSALVTVGPCGNALCGRIARVLKAPAGAATVDRNNPAAALRTRPIVGLPILSGFTAGKDDWRGRIYDPRNGKSYKSIVRRDFNGTLKVQGCIAFICQTQTWRPAS